jgi:subfamily B ATP-binding cassette protein MsbA
MKGGGKYIQVYFSALIGLDIVRKVRNRLLNQMLKLDISFFHQFRSGELISRNVNDVARIKAVVSTMIPEIGRQGLTAIGLLGVVIYQSPKLSFFALIILPLIIFPLSLIAKKLKKLSHKSQEKTSDITSRLTEIFANVELIKAHAAEKFEHDKFAKENYDFYKISLKSVKTSELTGPLMELQDAVAAGERILYIFDQEPNIVSKENKSIKDIKSLTFQDVTLKYGDKSALNGITFNVSKGEKLALVGDSGGGKSSIVNLIMRFYDPNSGEIKIDDRSIDSFSLEALRNSISIVTQRVYIFNDTIAANVAYGKEIDAEKVTECLKQANALEFVDELGGINEILNEYGANLSGGQRQRIAIARALYVDPKILIFDEATSALDSKSEAKITEALERITKDRITIIIAHRLSTIQNADKIAVLKHGKVICINNEKVLLESCDEYKRLSGTFVSE